MSENVIPWSKAYDEKRLRLLDVLPLSLPLCICIEPTNVCNFKGQMCWQSTKAYREHGGPFQSMDMELLDKFLQDAKSFCTATGKRIKLIKLYSTGEPLLHKEIGEMVRRIKAAEVCDQIEITTNASLLTQEMAKEFVAYGLDYLRVSMYSVRKEHHREVTQTRVDPETIAQNVRFLYDYRHRGGKQKPFICAKIMDMGEVENEEFRSIYAPISDEQLIDIPWELPKTEESALSKLYGGKEAGKEAQKKFVESSVFKERKACRYPLCATCELPLHDRPEDAIDDLPVERLSWKEGQEDRT